MGDGGAHRYGGGAGVGRRHTQRGAWWRLLHRRLLHGCWRLLLLLLRLSFLPLLLLLLPLLWQLVPLCHAARRRVPANGHGVYTDGMACTCRRMRAAWHTMRSQLGSRAIINSVIC